ncbi:uncharacterized protein LOC141908291 isoform X2 [Tubulanus polymorphus]
MLKFYVHYEACTQVFEWDRSKKGTLSDVITQFISSTTTDKVKKELLTAFRDIQVFNSKGTLLDLDLDVSSNLKNREDIFLKLKESTNVKPPSEKTKGLESKLKFYLHYVPGDGESSTSIIEWHKSDKGSLRDLIKLYMNSGAEHLRSTQVNDIQLKNSKGVYLDLDREITSLLKNREDLYIIINEKVSGPQQSNSKSFDCARVKRICEKAATELKSGNTKSAVTLYQTVIQSDPTNVQALERMVDIFLTVKRPDVAVKYAKMLKKLKSCSVFHRIKLGKCFLMLENAAKSEKIFADIYENEMKNLPRNDQFDVKCALAQSYELQGMRDKAIIHYHNVMQQYTYHATAAVRYADLISSHHEKLFLSIQLTTTAMMLDRADTRIPVVLCKLVQKPGGVEILENIIGRQSAALFVLYEVLYNYGATNEAEKILFKAVQCDPNDLIILLAYMHLLELKGKHGACIQFMKTQLKTQSLASSVHQPHQQQLLEQYLNIIETVPEDIYLWNCLQYEDNTNTSSERPYGNIEIFFTAILFTSVKIFYVNGALRIVQKLMSILEHLWPGRDLHKTAIRNEAAYFRCIQLVMKQCPPDVINCSDLNSQNFLYFLSDSHCITPAWQKLLCKGTPVTVHPVLSTGTKIWHLRHEEKLYTREGFFTAIKVIPNNALVVVNFGEIDCRESLTTCVQKCYYDSLEEAMECLIDIYIKVLDNLQIEYRWKIYVHPIAPVIDVTRPIVVRFNQALRRRVEKHGTLKWLDIEKDLLKPAGSLKSIYEFDDTHLHPAYLELLQNAF